MYRALMLLLPEALEWARAMIQDDDDAAKVAAVKAQRKIKRSVVLMGIRKAKGVGT
jgi:hypothetical protein